MVKYVDRKDYTIATGAVFEGEQVYRSRRVDRLREAVMNCTPEISADRAALVTESYRQTESDPIELRRAKAMLHTLKHLNIEIREGELIVGEVGNRLRCAQIYPEFDINWVIEELDGKPVRFEKRPGDRYVIKPEDEKLLRGLAPYWQGKTHYDRVKARMPKEAWEAYEAGIINSQFLMISGEGHVVVNLKRVLKEGLESFKERARAVLDALDLAQPEDLRRKPFLESVILCCDAVHIFAQRYAQLARNKAEAEKDGGRT